MRKLVAAGLAIYVLSNWTPISIRFDNIVAISIFIR